MTETPLTFVVRDLATGTVIDTFREDELATWGTEKTWSEAAAWAYLAHAAYRRAASEPESPL